jgi:hypothetical protein
LYILCLKQGNDLSPLLLNCAFEYAIRKAQENEVGMELNGAHQLLAYSDDMSLLGDNIATVKTNTGIVNGACKGGDVEVNVEKTKYICCCLVTRMCRAKLGHIGG